MPKISNVAQQNIREMKLTIFIAFWKSQNLLAKAACLWEDYDDKIAAGLPAKLDDPVSKATVRVLFNDGTWCTGAIIHPDWVITAARCILNQKYPKDYVFVGGVINVDQPAAKRPGQRIVILPGFSQNSLEANDIALVKVESPFPMDAYTNVIELSNDPWPTEGDLAYHRLCQFYGWGSWDFHRTASSILLTVNLTARHGEYGCNCLKSGQNKGFICTNELERGPCVGDLGGPLVCDNQLVGLAHKLYFREECNPLRTKPITKTCARATAAYTYLCPHLSWINKYVPSAPVTPSQCRSCKLKIGMVLIVSAWISTL